MTGEPGSGGNQWQAPVLVLPADLDRWSRLSDDAELERLVKEATEEDQRRGSTLRAIRSNQGSGWKGPRHQKRRGRNLAPFIQHGATM